MSPAPFIVYRRRAVLLALAPLTLALAWAGAHLEFDFTPQAIYAGDGDLVEHAEAFEDVFGHDDAVLLVILEAREADDALGPQALAWCKAFAQAAADVPHVVRVTSLATVPVPDPGPSGLRTLLERQPMLREAFLSEDLRWLASHVHLDPAIEDIGRVTSILAALRSVIDRLPPPEGHAVRLAGLPELRSQVVVDLKREQLTRMPAIAVIFFLVLFLAYRRIGVTLLPLIAVGVGLVWTTGALVMTGHALNIISNILPILLFTIGTANCVHVLNRYAEECARGPTREAAAVRTVRHMAIACLLTYLTTAIGFLSLLAARSDVLREVGLETALGLALLYVATIVVLGAMLAAVRPRLPPSADGARGWSIDRFTAAAGAAVVRHPVPILVASLLLMAACAWSATHLEVNCSLLETYDEDHPVTRTMHDVEERLGGVLSIDVDLEAEGEGALVDADVARRITEIVTLALDEAPVLRARAYPQIHEAVLAGAGLATSPAGPALTRMAHGLSTRLAPLVAYHRYVAPDGRRARIEVRVRDVGSCRLLELAATLRRETDARFPPGGPVRARLTGQAYVYAAAMDHFVRDMLLSLLGAAVVIFGVIALLFRSPRYGLISMLPNLTPLVLTLGYMRLRGYELNTSSAIVFAISLGVAVDNTIHFLARYREEHARDGDVAAAIQRTLMGAGRAMVLTSLVIILGLAVLHGSDFVPTRRFAEITSVTMVAALLGDLLLLPACLRLFSARVRTAR